MIRELKRYLGCLLMIRHAWHELGTDQFGSDLRWLVGTSGAMTPWANILLAEADRERDGRD